MNKAALVEIINQKPLLEKREDGLTVLSGIASEAGVKNGNGRVYPLEVMRRAVEEAQAKITEGAFNGELDHPEYGYRGTLGRTAMRFTRLFMEGNLVKFEAVLLETPDGQKLKALLDGGVKIGMSTSGAGSLVYEELEDGDEVLYVDSDYEMFGIDAVDIPSSAKGILKIQESIESRINAEKGYQMKDIKTVAELRENYGTLVNEVEKAAKAEASQEVEAGKTEKQTLETQLSESKAEVERLKGELTEATKSVEAMGEIKKQLLGETKAETVNDDVVVGKIDSLMETVTTLTKNYDALQKSINEAKEREVTVAKLKSLFETEVAGQDYENILRKRINPEMFESEEALKAKLVEYREVLADTPKSNLKESVAEGEESGKGVVESDNEQDKVALTEAERQERILSGLPV